MGKIFAGLIFILIDFTLTINGIKIELIPDVVGFILIAMGAGELGDNKKYFDKVSNVAIVFAICSVIMYMLEFFGISANLGVIGTILGFIFTFIPVVMQYLIVDAIRDVESARAVDLESDILQKLVFIMIFTDIVACMSMFIPASILTVAVAEIIAGVTVLVVIGGLVVNILFLIKFYNTKGWYEARFRA